MELLSILLIAVGLSMDSLTVSMAAASSYRNKTTFIYLRFAFTLGFIQAVCTLGGWAAGAELTKYLEDYDHWIAFGLLVIIGGKMLYEGIKHKDSEEKPEINMDNFFVVTGLGIATSIDAAVVGVSLSFVGINIWVSAVIIMLVTFAFSYIGLFSGDIIRRKLKRVPVEVVGGVFLIGIGIKIIIEHLANGC